MNTQVIQIIFFILPWISLISSLFIIITYGRFRTALKRGNSFVFYLSVCDFFFSLKIVMTAFLNHAGYPQYSDDNIHPSLINSACFWMGVWGQFTSTATTSWNMMISLRLFLGFVHKHGTRLRESWPFHLYVWLFSTLNCLVLIYWRAFGPGYNGCWIVSRLKFRLFYLIPLGTYLFLSIIILVYILIAMKRARTQLQISPTVQDTYEQEEHNFRQQLIKYTVVFIVMWAIPFASRLAESANYVRTFTVLPDLLSTSLQAFANSVVWATSPHFLEYWRGSYTKHFSERDRLLNTSAYAG